jgi:sulfide dehydrogenase cytochrome subunit
MQKTDEVQPNLVASGGLMRAWHVLLQKASLASPGRPTSLRGSATADEPVMHNTLFGRSRLPVALALLAPCLTWAQAQPVAAAPTLERQARVWAASCAACHGTEGRAQGAIPALAGRDAGALLRALLEFKRGERPTATVMHQHAKGYSDDELRRIANVFASQR